MRCSIEGTMLSVEQSDRGYVNFTVLPDDSTTVLRGYLKVGQADHGLVTALLSTERLTPCRMTGDLYLNQGQDGRPASLNFRPISAEFGTAVASPQGD